MKSKLLFSLLILISFTINAQSTYKVIKVNGKIVQLSNNNALNTGSTFNDNETFNFVSSNSMAAVISAGSGDRFILKNQGAANASAKANLAPGMKSQSPRGGALLNIIDLKNHFQGEYAIIDSVEIEIASSQFKMDDSNFFFIRYKYKGEQINKKLGAENNKLKINKEKLFTVDGNPIPNPNVTNMDIFYYRGRTQESVLINTFEPVFVDPNELVGEIKILLEYLTDLSKEKQLQEVISYVTEMYGKPNKDNIVNFMKKNGFLG